MKEDRQVLRPVLDGSEGGGIGLGSRLRSPAISVSDSSNVWSSCEWIVEGEFGWVILGCEFQRSFVVIPIQLH